MGSCAFKYVSGWRLSDWSSFQCGLRVDVEAIDSSTGLFAKRLANLAPIDPPGNKSLHASQLVLGLLESRLTVLSRRRRTTLFGAARFGDELARAVSSPRLRLWPDVPSPQLQTKHVLRAMPVDEKRVLFLKLMLIAPPCFADQSSAVALSNKGIAAHGSH